MRRLPELECISVNQAALKILRKGAGLTDNAKPEGAIGHSLDHLVGIWTLEEAEEFDTAIELFEAVDQEVWQ